MASSQHYHHPRYIYNAGQHTSVPPTRSSMVQPPMRVYEPPMLPQRQHYIDYPQKHYHHSAYPPIIHSTIRYRPPAAAPLDASYPPSMYRPAQGILSVNQFLSLAYTPASSNATTPSSYEDEPPQNVWQRRNIDETAIRQFAWPIDGRLQAERDEQQHTPTYSPQPTPALSPYWPDTFLFNGDDHSSDSLVSPSSAFSEHIFTPFNLTPPTPMRSVASTTSNDTENVNVLTQSSSVYSAPIHASRHAEMGTPPPTGSSDWSAADSLLSSLSQGDLLQRTISARLADCRDDQVNHFAKAQREYEEETKRRTNKKRATRVTVSATARSQSPVATSSEPVDESSVSSAADRVSNNRKRARRAVAPPKAGERLCEMCEARAVLLGYGSERFCSPKCARTYSIEIRHNRNKRQSTVKDETQNETSPTSSESVDAE